MYGCNKKKFVPLIKQKNVIKTVNTTNYHNNVHDFVKYKIIWARKSDKIKNDIDFDIEKLMHEKKKEINIDNLQEEKKQELFEKLNKFEKYSAINLKNQRRIN